MIRNFRILSIIADEHEWLLAYLQSVIACQSNAKVFLNLIKERVREYESRNKGPSFEFGEGLNKHKIKSERVK